MISLSSTECRVLGVLVEKELTTPEQYPLTANATANGCNQKNNRFPITEFTEDLVRDAMESLREKKLVIQMYPAGSRVPKFRHQMNEVVQISRYELVVLAELMLRGPQTVGEIRGRASRMHHLDSIEVTQEMLDKMAGRPEPLVKQVAPVPGSRALRYVQLLCPEAHSLDVAESALDQAAGASIGGREPLSQRVELLEKQVAAMTQTLRDLAAAVGEKDPLPPSTP